MLNNVPTGINAMARSVIMRHPNSFNARVYRRKMLRSDPAAGGAPTMGGRMVLSSSDESEISWELQGWAFALPAEAFSGGSMMDRRDAANGDGAMELRFLMEPEPQFAEEGRFDIKKDDVFYLVLGDGDDAPSIAYEVIDVNAAVNMPPYVPIYIVTRRDDLDLGITSEESGE